MTEGRSNDSGFALYQVGEKIPVELPSGKVKEYEELLLGMYHTLWGQSTVTEWMSM